MKKFIYLPKNLKRLKWQIFKNINLADTCFISVFALISFCWWIIPSLSWQVQLSLTIIFLVLGTSLMISNHENRLYELIFKYIYFLFTKHKKEKHQIFPLDYIQDNTNPFILASQKNYFSAWSIGFKSLLTIDEAGLNQIVNNFEKFLKYFQSNDIAFYKVNQNLDLTSQETSLKTILANHKNNLNLKQLLETELANCKDIKSSKEFLASKVIIIVYYSSLAEASKSYYQFNNWISTNYYTKPLDLASFKKAFNVDKWNQIKDFKVKANSFNCDEKKYKLSAIYNYPYKSPYFWLNLLFSNADNEALVYISEIAKDKALKFLNNAYQKADMKYYYDSKISENVDTLSYKQQIQETIYAITNETDILKDVSVYILSNLESKEKEIAYRSLANDFKATLGIKLSKLITQQKQALQCYFPTRGKPSDILDSYAIPFTANQIASSYFLPSNSLLDDNGFFLGIILDNNLPIYFDLFYKDSIRINSNIMLIGTSGSGKSYLAKKIILNEYLKDTKIFILDPENEYESLTKNLNGKYLEIAKSIYHINPLEIMAFDGDDNPYQEQIKFLNSFYQILFPQASNRLYIHLLCNLTEYCYKQFNINENSNFLVVKNFPTFNDLAKNLNKFIKDKANKDLTKEHLVELKYLVNQLTSGIYSHNFNQNTKLDLTNAITTFNLNKVFNQDSGQMLNIYMFLLLRVIEKQMIANKFANQKISKNQRFFIVVDEAHLLTNNDNPLALKFLYQVSKRIRKYNGALLIATQGIKDMVNNSVDARYTEEIINNSQYLLYGKLKEQGLNDLIKIHEKLGGINSDILQAIANASQGQFFFKISNNQQYLIEVLSSEKEKLFLEKDNKE